MPRRKDSFSRALADAQKRLAKAEEERTRCQMRVVDLNVEIPRLQNIIASLSGKQEVGTKTAWIKAEGYPEHSLGTPPLNMTPEEQAKWYTERDLAGVSSIPPGVAKPAVPLPTEDELLPDDLPGKPVLEK